MILVTALKCQEAGVIFLPILHTRRLRLTRAACLGPASCHLGADTQTPEHSVSALVTPHGKDFVEKK